MYFLQIVFLGFMLLNPSLSHAKTSAESQSDQLMTQGVASFQKGSFGQAATHWMDAAQLYEQEGDPVSQATALTKVCRALHKMGQFKKAVQSCETALSLASQAKDPGQTAFILGRLGNLFMALGKEEKALKLLNQGLALSREQDHSRLSAFLLNDLGNIMVQQGKYSEAMGAYTESSLLAGATNETSLAQRALINSATAARHQGLLSNAMERLDLAFEKVKTLVDTHEKVYSLLNIGLGYENLIPHVETEGALPETRRLAAKGSRGVAILPGQNQEPFELPETVVEDTKIDRDPPPEAEEVAAPILPDTEENLLKKASEAFLAAKRSSEQAGDIRGKSYAWGYLGHLSELSGNHEEGLTRSRHAILAAQKVNAPESLFRWHWQTARILYAQGKEQESIHAYQRAVNTMQPIRNEYLKGYYGKKVSFRQSVGPLYFELADLLLQQAAGTYDEQLIQTSLIQARDTMENFKTAELQDYFQDECVQAATRKTIDVVSKETGIIYPVILRDRLELLVSLPNGLKRYAVPVSQEALTQVARSFRVSLEDRTSENYLSPSQQLHTWLIEPLENDLREQSVKTLVFVPDGALRSIPMAALHDGNDFLIKKYAMAITPGLSLTDPRPINRSNIKFLSMGLTEAVQGFPALPYVESELKAVKALYTGKTLLNKEFVIPVMAQEMKEEQFSIMHIASHGLVQKNAKDTFILSYDEKITMDRLAELIGLYKFRDSPLELLTLSACETAAGDDQAALGLAGVAIKAGARSALASLWFIDDKATSDLVSEFYTQLKDPTISKATALQRAQIKTLEVPDQQHPSYWAPFLLINNWL